MQPKELLENIIHTSHVNGVDLDLENLKFNEFVGGKYIEFAVPLQPIEFTNERKVNDITNMMLTFTTSYNGTKANLITLHTERLVCTNGMKAWGIAATLKTKNTAGGKKKVLTYGNEVMKIMAGAEEFKEKLIALDKIKVTQKDVDAYLSTLLGYDVTENVHPNSQKMLDKINASVALEFERTGTTMFGLLQGITHYTNHAAERPDDVSRDEYIRFRTGATINENAQKLAFAALN